MNTVSIAAEIEQETDPTSRGATRFGSLIEEIEGRGERECIVALGRSHTCRDLIVGMRDWLRILSEHRVLPGQVVGIQADYSSGAVSLLLALLHRGCVAAMIPRDTPEVESYLSEACAVGSFRFDPAGAWAWCGRAEGGDHPLPAVLREDREPGFVVFTSGSTGKPKAVLHGVERFLSELDGRGERLTTLNPPSFDHIAGLDMLFHTLRHGGSLIIPGPPENGQKKVRPS